MELKITNTLTKKKEIFVPIEDNKIKMYVCGVTPYDYSHIGHGRVYVFFDFMVRVLRFLGYKVTYIRNFTDIDDKIINKAEKEGVDFTAISQKYIEAFTSDMQRLNCITPEVEPKVTEHIPQIITFVKELVENKKAYVIDSDVYFDISSFKDYGKLSGRSLDDMLAGARVETDLRKKNPGDFALWKGNTQNLYWISPWGYGRPGWHIECSVMAKCYLGTTIDIHGGGMDLIFPHHENEVAQSEALHGVCFSHYWLHNAFLTINKEKMSKSLGNFVTLRDIFTQFDPMVLRYFILQHHYRTPIDFGIEELKASQVAYKKLINVFGAVDSTTVTHRKVLDASVDNKAVLEMVLALCDDLNSPKLIGLVFENLDKAKNDVILAEIIKFLLSNVMGLTLQPLKEVGSEFTPEIEALINKREQARKDKNWALADKVRDELVKLGYKPQDKKI